MKDLITKISIFFIQDVMILRHKIPTGNPFSQVHYVYLTQLLFQPPTISFNL